MKRIIKSGNSNYLLIGKAEQRKSGIKEGDFVHIVATKGKLSIYKAETKPQQATQAVLEVGADKDLADKKNGTTDTLGGEDNG